LARGQLALTHRDATWGGINDRHQRTPSRDALLNSTTRRSPASGILGWWNGVRRLVPILTLVLVSAGYAETARPEQGKLRWTVEVAKVERSAAVVLPAAMTSGYRGRVIEPLEIEDKHEALERAYLIHLRIFNASDTVQVLRFDVTHDPYLRLTDGREVMPIGYKLPGLSAPSLAVHGVLEVEVPPRKSYPLFPAFVLDAQRPRAVLIFEGAGKVKLPR